LEADMMAQQHADLSLLLAGFNLLVQAFVLIPITGHYRDDKDRGPLMAQLCVLSFITSMVLGGSTRAHVCCIRGASSVRDFLSKDLGDEEDLMFLFEVAAAAAAADTTIPTQEVLHEWATRVYPEWTERRRLPPPYDIADTILAGSAAARHYMSWLCLDSPIARPHHSHPPRSSLPQTHYHLPPAPPLPARQPGHPPPTPSLFPASQL
jgi:hypothetical protein